MNIACLTIRGVMTGLFFQCWKNKSLYVKFELQRDNGRYGRQVVILDVVLTAIDIAEEMFLNDKDAADN